MASQELQGARQRVEEARAALDADIATLSDRLPAAATLARSGAAGGAGMALLGVGAKVAQGRLSRRSEEKALAREARIQAKAIAAAIAAQVEAQRVAEEDRAAREAARAAKAEAKAAKERDAAAGRDDQDDDGVSWGLLLLVVTAIAAVVAYVQNQRAADEDIWLTQP